MNIKVNFDNIKVKETKKDFTVKILMLKGEKGEQGDLNPSHIVDNLTSNDSSKVLSAKQGKVLKGLVDKKPYYFDTVADMKEYDLHNDDIVMVKNKTYSIIDIDNATSVNMTFNSTKNRYELKGNSVQNGTPTINNPVSFEDTYTSGFYKTTINNKTYIFELKENLKSLNGFRDVFWLNTTNGTMGVEKYIKEIVLNGNESWELLDNSTYSDTFLRFRTISYSDVYSSSSTLETYISSNKLEGIPLATRTQNGIARQLDSSGINIFIDKSYLSVENPTGFAEFLELNNINVRYRTENAKFITYDDIILNNGLLAKQIEEYNISSESKSILDYSKYVENNDWLNAFNQAVLEDVKSLYIPKGNYNISNTFTITNGMKIYGDGVNSNIILSSLDGSANAVIEFNHSDNSSLQDLSISSIKNGIELISGVYINYSDYVYLNNIKIHDINGDGINIVMENTPGNTSYDCKLNNIDVYNCTGNGYNLGATDLFLSNCIARNVEKHGFYFTRSNSLLVNCKAYWTGKENDETTGDGFYLKTDYYDTYYPTHQGHKTRMINCEAQECGRYGFSLINTDSCQLIGCQSDTNGMYCENITSYGYYLKDNRNLKLIGSVANQNLVGWIKIPLYFDGGNNNNIQITAQLLEYGTNYYKFFDDLYTVLNYNPSNEIYINNNQINKPDYKNDLYNYDNTTGVATDFTFDHWGDTATSEIDFNNKAQKIIFDYTSGSVVDNNSKIYKDFNVSYENFNKISMSALCKNENLYTKAFIKFKFYDSNNTLLKAIDNSVRLYGDDRDNKAYQWNTLVLDTDVPQNTVKVRVELITSLISSGVTAQQGGSSWFKDFKLCCYNQ